MNVVTFAIPAALALLGAVVTVFARDVMRMALGLGAFLLGVAGLYLWEGMAFLAAAQVFVYVGGVLVLVLFAVDVVRRDPTGRPETGSRHDLTAAVAAGGVFLLIANGLRDVPVGTPVGSGADRVAEALLGAFVWQFEAVGLLLLVALVAVAAIMARGVRR